MNPRALPDEEPEPETRLVLRHLALHYIGVTEVTGETGVTSEAWDRRSGAPVDLEALDATIRDLLLKILDEAWDKTDASSVQAARFDPDPEQPERRRLRLLLERLEQQVWNGSPAAARDGDPFFQCSLEVERRLFECTPKSASSGLVLMADFAHRSSDRRYLAILKMRHADDRLVTLVPDSLTELTVQEIKMMLTREILKGIIWPHPGNPSFDLKLFDDQAKAEQPPARYFTEEFLGCLRHESDARRAAALTDLPAKIADQANREIDEDQARDYQESLLTKTEPTAEKVAAQALETGLIGGISGPELELLIEQDMGLELSELAYASEIESRLQDLADDHDLEYHPEHGQAFAVAMDREMTADGTATKEALIDSGAAGDLTEPEVDTLVAQVAEVPRAALIREGKKTRTHWVVFRVPRRSGDTTPDVDVRITGPRETLRRFVGRHGGRRSFHIETAKTDFRERP